MTREEAIKIIEMNPQEIWRAGITMEEEKEAFNMAIEALKEPKQGEWIEHRQFNPIGCFYSEYECSNCHDDVWQKTEWQFCPNCGARMREGDEK